ncbi:MAG: tetratricopeptide repeat protein, partial [Gammaproteobacteria bacterium]
MKNPVIVILLCGVFQTQVNAELGMVIEGDPIIAFRTAKKDAEQGDVESQYRLGRMYAQGLIVQRNTKKSFRWLEKAAQQDHQQALYFLGQMHLSGSGDLQKDHQKGVAYLTRAAELGLPEAKKKLVSLYLYPRQ